MIKRRMGPWDRPARQLRFLDNRIGAVDNGPVPDRKSIVNIFEIVSAIAAPASAVAAVIAAIGIWYGIRAMVRANNEREQQQHEAMQLQRETMQQQREADERRHEENMTALKALIAGLERQTSSLETVIERTAR